MARRGSNATGEKGVAYGEQNATEHVKQHVNLKDCLPSSSL